MKRPVFIALALLASMVGGYVLRAPAVDGVRHAAGGDSTPPRASAPAGTAAYVAGSAPSDAADAAQPYVVHAAPKIDPSVAARLGSHGPNDPGVDDRSPPIDRTEAEEVLPGAADMATPQSYAKWLERQREERMQRLADDARQALQTLREDIARAEARGMTPEQREQARIKLAHYESNVALLSASHGDGPVPNAPQALPEPEPPVPPPDVPPPINLPPGELPADAPPG